MTARISQPTTSSSGVSDASSPRLVWVHIAATVVGVLALVAVLVALHLGHLYDIFNHDSSYFPLVLEDILEDPANFRHWYPPTTSFYFPEWILFGLPYLITRSFYFSMAAVIVLHTLILFFIVYAINRQIDRSQAWLASVTTTVLLLFLALQDGYTHEYTPLLSTFRLIFYTLWHYGALLMSLLSFLVLVKLHTRPYTNRQYVLRVSVLGLLIFLTVTSDQIMLVWFSGPAIATLGYHWLTTRTSTRSPASRDPVTRDPVTRDPVTRDPVTRDPVTRDPVTRDPVTRDPVTRDPVTRGLATPTRRIYFTMGVVAFASIVGNLVYPFTVLHDFATDRTMLSFNGIVQDVIRMIIHIGDSLSSFLIINHYIVGLHVLVLLLVYRKGLSDIPTPLRLSLVYMGMTFIAISAAIMGTPSQFERRYFLPTYMLSIILAPSLGIYCYRRYISAKRATTHICYALLVICLVVGQVMVLRIIQENDEIVSTRIAYTFDELQCIDQVIARYNLRYGATDYDYAKALQAMSTHDIEIAQYFYDTDHLLLQELHWITSVQYFKGKYDFAIVGTDVPSHSYYYLWRHLLLRDYPVPTHRTVCGSKEVFIYPKGGLVMNTIETK